MIAFLTLIHVVNCVLLIIAVLLQSSKGGGLAGAFGGGGGSQAVFGGRGAATFLSKATTGLAIVFMVTSLGLTVLGRTASSGSESAVKRVLETEQRSGAPTQGLPIPSSPLPAEEGDAQAPPPGTVEGGLPAGGAASSATGEGSPAGDAPPPADAPAPSEGN